MTATEGSLETFQQVNRLLVFDEQVDRFGRSIAGAAGAVVGEDLGAPSGRLCRRDG